MYSKICFGEKTRQNIHPFRVNIFFNFSPSALSICISEIYRTKLNRNTSNWPEMTECARNWLTIPCARYLPGPVATGHETRIRRQNQCGLRDRLTFQRRRRQATLHVLPPARGGGAHQVLRPEQRERPREGLRRNPRRICLEVSQWRGSSAETISGGEDGNEELDTGETGGRR